MLTACKERGPDPDLIRFFDQKAFLEHMTHSFIIPSYKDLSEKATDLDTAVNRLVKDPNAETLTAAKLALRSAMISWQYCAPFELGPARLVGLAEKINTFPADTGRIEANMRSGFYNLSSADNSHARGFAALDYLLNDRSLTNEAIISKIYNRASVQGYLVQASGNVAFAVNTIYRFWLPEGENYAEIFTSDQALGVDEESSVAALVNSMARNLELLVTESKISAPLRGTGGTPNPRATEAFHGGYSMRLVRASIEAMQLVYEGRNREGLDGPGFDDYLNIKSSRVGDSQELLEDAIRNRYQLVNTAIAAVSDPLSERMASSPALVRQLQNQLNALTILYKKELANALRVEIDY